MDIVLRQLLSAFISLLLASVTLSSTSSVLRLPASLASAGGVGACKVGARAVTVVDRLEVDLATPVHAELVDLPRGAGGRRLHCRRWCCHVLSLDPEVTRPFEVQVEVEDGGET
jgi:hypothetical protein